MDTKRAALSTIGILILAGCTAGQPASTAPPTASAATTPAPTLAPRPTPSLSPTVAPTPAVAPLPTATLAAISPCQSVESDAFVVVDSRANIFGAGHLQPPSPGGGGGGELPAEVDVDIVDGAEVTFPCTSGIVDCCAGGQYTTPAGPEGGRGWHTDIESVGGLSGILHDNSGVFLAGVFVGDEEPVDPAPERLDFTETCPLECTFATLEPELGQVFYIGPGGDSPVYVAPEGATRLFLGVPDATFVQGPVGSYNNNSGEFQAAVNVR